jgi:hypothetical protein
MRKFVMMLGLLLTTMCIKEARSDSGPLLYGCENIKTGSVIRIKTKVHTCPRNYRDISWNIVGQQGPPGVCSCPVATPTDVAEATSTQTALPTATVTPEIPTQPPYTNTPTPNDTFTPTPTLTPTAETTQVIVGANLAGYQRPTEDQCDINVPAQYSTIKAAVDAAVAGDTVCVGAGTYEEYDLRITKTLRLAGNGFGEKSIINSHNAAGPPFGAIMITEAHNVIVEGFEIHGASPTPSWQATIFANDSTNTTIRYNHIIAGEGGRAIWRATSNLDGFVAQNNILEGNNSTEIFALGGGPTPLDNDNNILVINNEFTGTVSGGQGPLLSVTPPNTRVERNVFNATGSVRFVVLFAWCTIEGGFNYNNTSSSIDLTAQTLVAISDPTTVGCGSVNAEHNWWGTENPWIGDFYDGVDYEPFATSPFAQY